MAKRIRSRKASAPSAAARTSRAAAAAAVMLPGEARPAQAIETNVGVARLLGEAVKEERRRLADKTTRPRERDTPARLKRRSALIFPQDTVGLERIVGERDIVQITFLHEALRAARAVCRIKIRGESPAPPDFGTGFLVAPSVLLTNHHVLDLPQTASLSLAEFDAELDLNFVEVQPRLFNLLPERLFVTSADLDFAFVAVNPVAQTVRRSPRSAGCR